MSLPAVNKNVNTTSTSASYRKLNGDPTWYFITNFSAITRRDADSKPAGVTKPFVKIPFDWRYPTGWTRDITQYEWRCDRQIFAEDNHGSTGRKDRFDSPSGSWANGPLFDQVVPSFSSNLKNRVVAEALEKLKNQKFHAGNFIGTFDETANLVAGAAKRIAKGVGRWRSLNPKRWKDVVAHEPSRKRKDWCLIPNSWLELQYGWIPLMQDVQGALAALASAAKAEGVVVGVTHHRSYTDTLTYPWSGWNVKCDLSLDYKDFCSVSLWYRLRNANLAELSSLGLLNPAEVVWERLIYSFVVDWFAPIGTWLSALTADAGFDFISGTCTQVWRSKDVRTSNPRIVSSPVVAIESAGLPQIKYYKRLKMARTVYTSAPVPGIYVKNPLGVRHVLNALALLAQAFK